MCTRLLVVPDVQPDRYVSYEGVVEDASARSQVARRATSNSSDARAMESIFFGQIQEACAVKGLTPCHLDMSDAVCFALLCSGA